MAIGVIAAVTVLCGLAFAGGGGLLAPLGGSWYYLVAGIVLCIGGVLLFRRRAAGAWIYSGFLAVTLAWAIIEVGFAPWPLAPRLLAPALLAFLYFMPSVRRHIGFAATATAGTGTALIITLVGAFVLADPFDVAAASPLAKSSASAPPAEAAGDSWTSWGGNPGGSRFSTLTDLTPANVRSLERAWTYRTRVDPLKSNGYLSATPIMVEDRLVLCAQNNEVMALDPETGSETWRFDPAVDPTGASAVRTCRGVAYAETPEADDCRSRIFTATFDGRLIAVDTVSGRPCRLFGVGGSVDLREGMGDMPSGFYYPSAPPAVIGDKVVVGGWVADNQSIDEPSGVIRAYSVRDGALAWAWDAGNPANTMGPAEGEHYTRSTPNSWAPMSVDPELGLIFVPTGNPTPDHYAGLRSPASKKYGSSVVALDAATGSVRWSFQTTHLDLWDYDVPAQPSLLTMGDVGREVPAIAIPTKRGEIFVLDRRTGKPIAPVEERPVPKRGAIETVAPTQPFSTFPSMAGRDLRESDMWGLTPFDQLWCRVRFRQLRYDGKLTPPGIDEALIYPSIGGGMNFGGVAIDPVKRLMIVNVLYYGTVVQLVPRAETDRLRASSSSHAVTDFGVPLPQEGTPFGVRLSPLASPLGVPCNSPPFGRIAAIDIDRQTVSWQRAFGTTRDAGPFGLSLGLPIPMGAPNFGGALTTAGGLTFIGAAREKTFRAFETQTGREVWSARIPASAQTLPMTYRSPRSGRQFVVITAGGHQMLQSPLSDTIVAFALPQDSKEN